MTQLLICTRSSDRIFDYAIYSRELAPVNFSSVSSGLGIRRDPCNQLSQFYMVQDHHLQGEDKIDDFPSVFSYVYVMKKAYLQLPANVACCALNELKRSRIFRKRFIRYLRKFHGFHDMNEYQCCCTDLSSLCDSVLYVRYMVEMFSFPATANICFSWCYRLNGLLARRVALEENMAWLSTLGGGFSALGDYFQQHSQRAGRISVSQLAIAVQLGDEGMAARCRLFFALSLMQQGHLRRSKRIIRHEYRLASSQTVRDEKLVQICKGVWSKLQYYYATRNGQLRHLNVAQITA